jgi:hypothetical protein
MIGGGHQRGTYSPDGAGTSILLLSILAPRYRPPAPGTSLHGLFQHPLSYRPGALLPPGSNLPILPRAGGIVNGAA